VWDETGQAYNINADTVAGELRGSRGGVDFTDRHGGYFKGLQRPTLLYKLDIQEARRLIATGVVGGGMIQGELLCAITAQGVRAAHIIDVGYPRPTAGNLYHTGSMIVGLEFMS